MLTKHGHRQYGFTPVFNDVVDQARTTSALVYGVVWRHCHLRYRVCQASHATMSSLTGLAETTIQMHIKKLIDEELIERVQAHTRSRPAHYAIIARNATDVQLRETEIGTLSLYRNQRFGFTPLFDDIVEQVGSITALVFGVIWRHAQMRDAACHASVKTMSDLTGLGKSTIRKHIQVLVRNQMIKRVEPHRQHIPPWYVPVVMPAVVQAQVIPF